MRRVLLIAILAACGHGSSAPPEPVRHQPPTTSEAQPAGADDLVVARVDGRPVYASCVQAQARALGLDVRAALDQCVHFELLAEAAEQAGLRDDPEVAEAWRREMVRALIERDLGAIQTLDDLPPEFVQPLVQKSEPQIHRPEIRFAHYTRAKVPEGAVAGGPDDVAAREVADRAYAELRDVEGVLPDELRAAGLRAAAGTRVAIDSSDKPFATAGTDIPGMRGAVPEFRDALFAIPHLGRIAPPVRTKWGWDVILWWDVWPPEDRTASFFEKVRQKYFVTWAAKLARAAGVSPVIDDALLARLAASGGP